MTGQPKNSSSACKESPPPLDEPSALRRGNAPAYIHSGGSRVARLWASQCLDCDATLRWHRLLGDALADLAWHQEMHRVWRSELRKTEREAARKLVA